MDAGDFSTPPTAPLLLELLFDMANGKWPMILRDCVNRTRAGDWVELEVPFPRPSCFPRARVRHAVRSEGKVLVKARVEKGKTV